MHRDNAAGVRHGVATGSTVASCVRSISAVTTDIRDSPPSLNGNLEPLAKVSLLVLFVTFCGAV